MSIRNKTIYAIILTLTGVILIMFGVSKNVMLGSFEALERNNILENTHRAINALNSDLKSLDGLTNDWAQWDDSYDFIENGNTAYIKSNLVPESYTTNQLNIIIYVNHRREIIYGQAYDFATEQLIPLPAAFAPLLSANSILLTPIYNQSIETKTGIFVLPDGPMHIVSRPILTSNGEGPVRGVLIMGRVLDNEYWKSMAGKTRLSLKQYRLNQPDLPADVLMAASRINNEIEPIVTQVRGDNSIVAYTLINDIMEEPAIILSVDSPRSIFMQGKRSFHYLLMAVTVTGISAIIVLVILLQRLVIGRLSKLTTNVALVFKEGSYIGRLDPDTEDEIGALTSQINTMLAAIEQSQNELKQEVEARIRAHENAEKANEAKSRFLSSMSHELRTPLNAIMGFSQLFEYDNGLTDNHKLNAREIYNAGNHLLSLINEVLDLAKIESGHIELNMEEVSLSKILEECNKLVSPLAESYGISLDFKSSQCINMFVKADYTRLKQVMLNLLSNAIKYNCKNGYVSISCMTDKTDYIRISVRDTGHGISEDNSRKLFKAFSRLGAEFSDIEGTGIGLVITKELVELMGGTIGVDSIVGKGSTFWVEFRSGTSSEFIQTFDNGDSKISVDD